MASFISHSRDSIRMLSGYGTLILMVVVPSLGSATHLNASSDEDAKTVAALDTKYQAAVESNDAATMDQILADDFVLVNGHGKVSTKADLIESARKKEVTYEYQHEEPLTQKVRVWGDTAVVTALHWIKAVQGGKSIDYKLWFSDTYVRTPTGWRYVFGQASLPLNKEEPPARLTAESATQLATTAARQAHVDFSTLLPPTIKFYPREEIAAHWSVWWEEKPDKNGMVTVGGDYSAVVDDSTGYVDLIPGR